VQGDSAQWAAIVQDDPAALPASRDLLPSEEEYGQRVFERKVPIMELEGRAYTQDAERMEESEMDLTSSPVASPGKVAVPALTMSGGALGLSGYCVGRQGIEMAPCGPLRHQRVQGEAQQAQQAVDLAESEEESYEYSADAFKFMQTTGLSNAGGAEPDATAAGAQVPPLVPEDEDLPATQPLSQADSPSMAVGGEGATADRTRGGGDGDYAINITSGNNSSSSSSSDDEDGAPPKKTRRGKHHKGKSKGIHQLKSWKKGRGRQTRDNGTSAPVGPSVPSVRTAVANTAYACLKDGLAQQRVQEKLKRLEARQKQQNPWR
jgi:hypothetical protein